MTLRMICDRGHNYNVYDLVDWSIPQGAPQCPKCRKEWLRDHYEFVTIERKRYEELLEYEQTIKQISDVVWLTP